MVACFIYLALLTQACCWFVSDAGHLHAAAVHVISRGRGVFPQCCPHHAESTSGGAVCPGFLANKGFNSEIVGVPTRLYDYCLRKVWDHAYPTCYKLAVQCLCLFHLVSQNTHDIITDWDTHGPLCDGSTSLGPQGITAFDFWATPYDFK